MTSLIRHPRYYDTFLCDQDFEFKTPSFMRLRHSIMRHLESPFCHIKEVVNAKILVMYGMYVQNTSIYTWGLLGNFTYHWELYENSMSLVYNGYGWGYSGLLRTMLPCTRVIQYYQFLHAKCHASLLLTSLLEYS